MPVQTCGRLQHVVQFASLAEYRCYPIPGTASEHVDGAEVTVTLLLTLPSISSSGVNGMILTKNSRWTPPLRALYSVVGIRESGKRLRVGTRSLKLGSLNVYLLAILRRDSLSIHPHVPSSYFVWLSGCYSTFP
jgi:hypothetical protein